MTPHLVNRQAQKQDYKTSVKPDLIFLNLWNPIAQKDPVSCNRTNNEKADQIVEG